jgi:lysophospholipase L1-like esterase
MKTALIIGDSHVEPSGAFGPDLARLLEAQGYAVTVAGVGSSNAHQWANQNVVCRPNRSWCVDQTKLPHRPDLLVISLGTNDAANAAAGGPSPSASVSDVKRIIARYNPVRYFWIGPPATNDTVPYYTNVAIAAYYNAAKASGLSIFDSRGVTAPLVAAKLGDGVHLYGSGAQTWANKVASAIALQSTATYAKIAVVAATLGALAILWRKGYI